MATVPSYGGNQAAPSAAPAGNFAAPQQVNAAPEQLQQLGQATERAGTVASSFAVDMQQQANQVRVDDALNKARQKVLDLGYGQDGYKNLRGDAALTRPDGRPITEEYGSKLRESLSTLSSELGNDAQRLAFTQNANALMGQFEAGLQEHANTEYKNYALSTQDGTIKLGADQAALDWQNPDKVQTSLDSVRAAVIRTGTLKGWSGSETTAKLNEIQSGIHTRVIDTALQESNPEYALGYMEKFKGQMTASDLLKVRGVINKDVTQRMADNIATGVMTGARRQAQPTDYDRMAAITAQSESGSRERDAAGNLITSPKGAQGAMQVMPTTNRNPGYGVKPARDDSDAERTRVGREYLQAMVKEYSGDATKAWAAYNWGPGNLDAAIKQHGADWLVYAPKETQQYVQKNMAALGGGGGVARPTLQDVHDQVRSNIEARFGATPPAGMVKLALNSATQQFEDMEKARKSTDDQNVVAAMQALPQVGGRFSELPYAIRSKIPADKVDTVISFGQKISKGDDITNPAVFQRLSDPKVLKGMSDDQFYQMRLELSQADFEKFSTQRGAALGKPTDPVGTLNMSAMNASLKNYMLKLNMDPTPKDKTPESIQLGVIKQQLTDAMLAEQKTTGKKMTDADVEKFIAGQFAKTTSFRTTFMGFETGSGTQRLLTMKPGDIPDDTRAALVNDFKAAGVSNPSDGDLLGAYLKLKSLPTRPRATAKPVDTAQSKSGTIKY